MTIDGNDNEFAMNSTAARFFYHNFPRRARQSADEIAVGLKILSLMVDAGLVLTPEVVTWSYDHADGTPPRSAEALQQRVCFTELSPAELPAHAERFGRFALEFTIPTLKLLGAIPVFYVPRLQSTSLGAQSAGDVLVMQLLDAMHMTSRIAVLHEQVEAQNLSDGSIVCTLGFSETGMRQINLDVGEFLRVSEVLTYALTPPEMMSQGLAGLTRFFYPADDAHNDEMLGYYRQREWRIAGNIAIRGEEIMRAPSDELIGRLLDIDAGFFGREFPPRSGKRLADGVFVLPGLATKRLIQMVNRIIVPADAVPQAEAILARIDGAPPVVAFEAVSD